MVALIAAYLGCLSDCACTSVPLYCTLDVSLTVPPLSARFLCNQPSYTTPQITFNASHQMLTKISFSWNLFQKPKRFCVSISFSNIGVKFKQRRWHYGTDKKSQGKLFLDALHSISCIYTDECLILLNMMKFWAKLSRQGVKIPRLSMIIKAAKCCSVEKCKLTNTAEIPWRAGQRQSMTIGAAQRCSAGQLMGCHQLSVCRAPTWPASSCPRCQQRMPHAHAGAHHPRAAPSSGPPVQATPTRPSGQFCDLCRSKSDHQWFSAASRSYLVLKEDEQRVKSLGRHRRSSFFGGFKTAAGRL